MTANRKMSAAALVAVMLVSACAHTPKATSVPATSVIAGRVTDWSGAPIDLVEVKASERTFAATNPDGKYSILNVNVGCRAVNNLEACSLG